MAEKTDKSLFRGAVEVAGGFATVVGVLYGFHAYLDYRIAAKIRDPRFMAELAYSLRPVVIFDSNNRILADQGALRFIESIKVIRGSSSPGVSSIVVTPKRFLAVAPLLESLDDPALEIKAERGEKLDWVYTLVNKQVFGNELTTNRFRLEVLNPLAGAS